MINVEVSRKEQVQDELKSQVLAKVLELIAGNPGLMISGSLSQLILDRAHSGVCNIGEDDLANIGDIDLVSDDHRLRNHIANSLAQISIPSFSIEFSELYRPCIYDQKVKYIALKRVKVQCGQSFADVWLTTPEFLLVSLVDEGLSEKTTTEKYDRKIARILSISNFDRARFIQLAKSEIESRRVMNENTFVLWKRNLIEKYRFNLNTNFQQLLKTEVAGIASLVNIPELLRLAPNLNSFKQISYDHVRQKTLLENFIEDF